MVTDAGINRLADPAATGCIRSLRTDQSLVCKTRHTVALHIKTDNTIIHIRIVIIATCKALTNPILVVILKL
jgi:hypothetical protein